jgi:hypothetical protein
MLAQAQFAQQGPCVLPIKCRSPGDAGFDLRTASDQQKIHPAGTNRGLIAWVGMMRWSSRGHFERDYLEERYVPHGWLVVAAIVIFMFLWIVMAVSVYRDMPVA